MSRPRIPAEAETRVLLMSRRRCCICYGLRADAAIKRGQIAHLDQDRSNNSAENLAFLCFEHHDEYDSRTSQAKGLTLREVKRNRDELYAALKGGLAEADRPARSPWSGAWPAGKWTADHDEALLFHTGTHRSQSVVASIAEGPKTLAEINASIPPHDESWTEVIAGAVVERGWIRALNSTPVRYELTEQGYRMLRALDEIPQPVKDAAWKSIWLSESPESA